MKRGFGWRRGGVFDLVKRHRDYDPRLHLKVMGQSPELVENCATPESRRLYEMQRAVLRCLHAKKGFLRLKASPHRILYARTELEHDVVDLLLSHFHRRYPTFHVALEWEAATYVVDTDGGVTMHPLRVEDVVKRLESQLPRSEPLAALPSDGRVWEEYYGSQEIIQRRNHTLMDHMMPKKHRDRDSYETFLERGCQRITDFA